MTGHQRVGTSAAGAAAAISLEAQEFLRVVGAGVCSLAKPSQGISFRGFSLLASAAISKHGWAKKGPKTFTSV